MTINPKQRWADEVQKNINNLRVKNGEEIFADRDIEEWLEQKA